LAYAWTHNQANELALSLHTGIDVKKDLIEASWGKEKGTKKKKDKFNVLIFVMSLCKGAKYPKRKKT
jgi:hypothetical protein